MHASIRTLDNAARVLRTSNYWKLADEIVTAISEIERLRKALLEIDEGTILQFEESEEREVEVWMDAEDMQEIARQALNPASPQTRLLVEDKP